MRAVGLVRGPAAVNQRGSPCLVRLSMVEPTDSKRSQSATPHVSKTRFRKSGSTRFNLGRILIDPVPHSHPASREVTSAQRPKSPLRANRMSPTSTQCRLSLARVLAFTVHFSFGRILPSLKLAGLISGVPPTTYSSECNWLPNGPVCSECARCRRRMILQRGGKAPSHSGVAGELAAPATASPAVVTFPEPLARLSHF